MKKCTKCYIEKPFLNFYADSKKKCGLRPSCKDCDERVAKLRKQARHEKDPHIRRSIVLKYKYGITLADFNEILAKQGNVCAICKAPDPKNSRHQLVVDHCHKSGIVRGILCTPCNLALGLFQDDLELVKAGVEYLCRTGVL